MLHIPTRQLDSPSIRIRRFAVLPDMRGDEKMGSRTFAPLSQFADGHPPCHSVAYVTEIHNATVTVVPSEGKP